VLSSDVETDLLRSFMASILVYADSSELHLSTRNTLRSMLDKMSDGQGDSIDFVDFDKAIPTLTEDLHVEEQEDCTHSQDEGKPLVEYSPAKQT
jgi:hypothetical protein